MKQWLTKPLGNYVLPTEQRDPRENPTQGFFYVDIASVDNEAKAIITTKRLIGADAPSRARKVIQTGDVIVSMVRPNLNAVALVPKSLNNEICSTGFSILRPSKDVLSRYLFAFTRSQTFIDHLAARTTGATYPAVSDDKVKNVPMPVLPLAEQERIVRLLDEADELRKLRAQADGGTASFIPALFHEMFGDPAANPFGWPVRRVGELMSACDYGTSQKANKDGRGIPVLRMGNVTTDGRLDLTDMKSLVLLDAELARQQLRAGDVLFNRTNSRELVGKTGMWDGRYEAVAASYFIRVRFRPDVARPEHFMTFMNLPIMKSRLAEMARGAIGQANINSKELQAIELPVPPLALQEEFARQVTEIQELEREQAASRQRLDDLFQSVLHRAFNSEM